MELSSNQRKTIERGRLVNRLVKTQVRLKPAYSLQIRSTNLYPVLSEIRRKEFIHQICTGLA